MSLLTRASARHFRRHPFQLLLAIVGVALGVAILVAIDIASVSSLAAFRLSTRAVTGSATHHIVGGSVGVPEGLYRELRVEHGLRTAAPVVEGLIYPEAAPGRILRLLGADPFAEIGFREFAGRASAESGAASPGELIARPDSVLLSSATAAHLGVAAGDRMPIEAAGRRQELHVAALIEDDSGLLGDLVVADISTAQEVLDHQGRLSRIDLRAPEGHGGADFENTVESLLPPGVELTSAGSSNETAAQMTRAFRLNLLALSLLAPVCGCFLIYNTISFAVVQRRGLFGILRVLGTSGRQIASIILGEALLMGVLGSALGLWAGTLLSRVLLSQMTQTIRDFYFTLTVQQVQLEPLTMIKGAALGIGGALVACILPASEALSTTPRSALDRAELEARTRRLVPKLAIAGALLCLAAAAVIWASTGLVAAFVGLFMLIFGLALLSPSATVGLMAVFTPLAGLLFGQLGRMAGRGTVAALSRTGVAVAALMIAVSVAMGVDLMIRSFRSTVESWLEYSLPADLYVSTASSSSGADGFDQEAVAGLQALAGVEEVNVVRRASVRLPGGPVRLMAYELTERGRESIVFTDSRYRRRWDAVERGEAVFISEPLAFLRSLEVGESLTLSTPSGRRSFEIAGLYVDYAGDQGAVLIDRDVYRSLWADHRVTAISIRAGPGIDPAVLADSVRSSLGGERLFNLRSNRALRTESLDVFDRTFLITGVLRLVAVIVAFIGVLGALTALQLERTRELGVLRACGLTPGQLWGLVSSETGLLGLVAGLLSIPVGVAMASVMIYVINRRSFGWSLDLQLAPESLLGAIGIALAAALLAGLYPAFKMASTSPAQAVRDE